MPAITKADLKSFYMTGFNLGLGWDRNAEATGDELKESFEAYYEHWRKQEKKISSAKVEPYDEKDYERWERGEAGAKRPLFERGPDGRFKP